MPTVLATASDTEPLDHAALDEYRRVIRPAQEQYISPAAGRLADLYGMNLSFLVERGGSSYKVFTGPDAILVLGKRNVIALSKRGAFQLTRKSSDDPYQVQTATTATDLTTNPNARQQFIDRVGAVGYGIAAQGGGNSLFRQADLIFGRTIAKVTDRVTEPSGLIRLTYTYTPPFVTKVPTLEAGTVLLDPAKQYVVLEHEYTMTRSGSAKPLLTKKVLATYHSPTSDISYPLVHELEVTEAFGSSKPKVTRHVFKEYRVERPPAEQLRLAYYGLPNELVEDTSGQSTIFWVVSVASGVAAVTLYWLWRRKRV